MVRSTRVTRPQIGARFLGRRARTSGRVAIFVLLPFAASPLTAREYSPRIVSPHRADAYSLRTFARFPRWRHLEGNARAWEIYRYLVDTQSGVFHFNEVLEGDESLSEHKTVRDPVKILNVYGYAYCAIFGPVMAGIAEGTGLGTARTVVLPAWSHVAAEAHYDDGWHYLDIDVRAAFRRPDGALASLDEARRERSLWVDRGPAFFPNDPLDKTRRIYEATPVHHYHGFQQYGHTMDFILRQGESFERWWTPQGGRWHHRAEYNSVPWLRRLIEEEPRGPKPNHRHFSIHDHSNGRFIYAPDLTEDSSDFDDGVWDMQNVKTSAHGLTLEEEGEGHATFEFHTPYIIVPLVGDLDSIEDDREASVVEIDSSQASIEISLDGGRSWRAVEPRAADSPTDLTALVAGSYGYLLKIALRGRPDEAIVRSLRVTTWVQVAPASLPALGRGRNRMEYRTGDHYGLRTRVAEIKPRARDPADLSRYVGELPERYEPNRPTARIKGSVALRIDAPPRSSIAWFAAEGSFRTHLHGEAERTRNSIAWAAGMREQFTEVYRSQVPTTTEHWHHNGAAEVILENPSKTIAVRFSGDPALNALRVFTHSIDAGRRSDGPVEITHIWKEGGQLQRSTVALEEAGAYEIVTEGDPENVSVMMALPSCRRQGGARSGD